MWQAAAYFDESDDNDRAYAVAGFIGHQQDCVHLHWVWEDKLLKKYNLEYFKASELNAGKGQFAQFRDNPRDLDKLFSEREKELFKQIKIESVDIILEFSLIQGFGAVLILPDYYRLLDEYESMGKPLPAPYFLCAQVVMMDTGSMMNDINASLPPEQRGIVRPVFDSHEQYSGRAKQMFDEFARKNPASSCSLLPPHYEDDKKYLMLQVADNLAYEIRRLLVTQEFTFLPEREAMHRLRERVRHAYKINYESLKLVMDSQQPDQMPIKPEIENKIALGKN